MPTRSPWLHRCRSRRRTHQEVNKRRVRPEQLDDQSIAGRGGFLWPSSVVLLNHLLARWNTARRADARSPPASSLRLGRRRVRACVGMPSSRAHNVWTATAAGERRARDRHPTLWARAAKSAPASDVSTAFGSRFRRHLRSTPAGAMCSLCNRRVPAWLVTSTETLRAHRRLAHERRGRVYEASVSSNIRRRCLCSRVTLSDGHTRLV